MYTTPKSAEDIVNRFSYHAPDAERVKQHEAVRRDVGNLAISLDMNLPPSREKSLALTKLEEAMFWANAAIARQGES